MVFTSHGIQGISQLLLSNVHILVLEGEGHLGGWFIFWIVQRGKAWMTQCLFSGDSLLWIELQHFGEQIQFFLGSVREQLFEWDRLLVLQILHVSFGFWVLDVLHIFFAWCAQCINDKIDLVNILRNITEYCY